MLKKNMPKRIYENDIVLIKISCKNDNNILNELLALYKSNKDHLLYWHHGWNELFFNNINDLKNHLIKKHLICYAVYNFDKIIGCIEVGKLYTDEEKLKYRILTYWIDKDSVRKGIIFNCLKLLEKIFIAQELNVLTTEVDVKNIPSIKLMEKLKFKLFSTCFQISENGETMCTFHSFQKILENNSL